MELEFNVPSGETVDRHKMIAYGNSGTYSSPKWGPIGLRVTSADLEYDWQKEDSKDILGNTFSIMKSPILTEAFDEWPLSGGDEVQKMIVNTAVVQQDARKLANMDMMIAHYYLTDGDTVAASFAERYPASAVEVTSLGGEGGSSLIMSSNVTFGGTREVGTVSNVDGEVTFTKGTVSTQSTMKEILGA